MRDFLIQTKPMAASRPKGTQSPKTGRVHFYIPSRTTDYEEEVSAAALSAGVTRLEGPVAVLLEFGLCRPKKGGIAAGDVDNLTKSILDGLLGAGQFRDMQIAYHDDRQVCLQVTRKIHVENPYARVRLGHLIDDRRVIAAALRELADEIEAAGGRHS